MKKKSKKKADQELYKTARKSLNNYIRAKRAFRDFLVEYTSCTVQEGEDGMSYPCGTCTIALFDGMGLKANKPAFSEHNEPHDRANEVWRAILQIRDHNVSTSKKAVKVFANEIKRERTMQELMKNAGLTLQDLMDSKKK